MIFFESTSFMRYYIISSKQVMSLKDVSLTGIRIVDLKEKINIRKT